MTKLNTTEVSAGLKVFTNIFAINYKIFPDAPEFHSSQGNFTVIEGEDISIRLKASGNPPITRFRWRARKVCGGFEKIFLCVKFWYYFQTDQLPDNFLIEDSKMEVRNTRREHAGLYFLEASNDLGDKTLQVHLHVQYHPTWVTTKDCNLSVPGKLSVLSKCQIWTESLLFPHSVNQRDPHHC